MGYNLEFSAFSLCVQTHNGSMMASVLLLHRMKKKLLIRTLKALHTQNERKENFG